MLTMHSTMVMRNITLHAYLYKVEKSGNLHLRVKQSQFHEDMKARLHRVGSPATWDNAAGYWDYPLTAAAVVALYRVADETGCTIQFSPDLAEFADQQKKLEDYEKAVRLAIEKTMQSKDAHP